MRTKLLIGGGTNTGKTTIIIQLASTFPDNQVRAFDAEGDLILSLEDMGIGVDENGQTDLLPNLKIFNVKPDWFELERKYREWKAELTPDDWLCFDMAGVFWDLAQECFAQMTWGKSLAERQVSIIKEKGRASFEGLDGLDHWPTIKKMHNTDLFDDSVRWSDFNVLATTSLTNYSAKEKIPVGGTEAIIAEEFGKKLEGEKHNIYRFRDIAIIYQPPKKQEFHFKMVKLKGKPLARPLVDYDFTGKSLIEEYLTTIRGVSLS